MERRADVVYTVKEEAPVSWDVTIWRKPGREKADAEKPPVSADSRRELFEEIVLPHLNAAYNLARWLTRNEQDAADVVQESYLRALRFFDGYKGGDPKSWLLTIVRNTCRTWQHREHRQTGSVPFDEAVHSTEDQATDQERSMADREEFGILRTCLDLLPVDFREVLVLRELEEMSYQEISDVTGLALGTVMSRLSRARKRLQQCAASRAREAVR